MSKICLRTKFEVGIIVLVTVLAGVASVTLGTRTITDSSDSINTMIVCSNGNTYTATAANLQAAIYSLNSTRGGTINIPACRITQTVPLVIPTSINLIGAGVSIQTGSQQPVTEVYLDNTFPANYSIWIHNRTNCVNYGSIKNILINGRDLTIPLGGIYMWGCNGWIIENVFIDDFFRTNATPPMSHGIHIESYIGYPTWFSYYNKIDSCKIRRCTVGVFLSDGANANTFINNYITNSRANAAAVGYYLNGSEGNVFLGGDIDSFNNASANGIIIRNGGYHNSFFAMRQEHTLVYTGMNISGVPSYGCNSVFGGTFAITGTTYGSNVKDTSTLKTKFYNVLYYDTEKYGNTSVANNGTITHGLEGTPKVVFVNPSMNWNISATAYAYNSTTFKVFIYNKVSGLPVTGNYYISWHAIV